MTNVDVSAAMRSFRSLYGDLTDRQFNQQVARALNHTARKSRTRVSKEIRAKYNIRASDVKKAVSLGPAIVSRLSATVKARSAALPIRAFRHRQTRKGVSVAITKGKRKVIKGAFVATMRNGHKSVFARGRYMQGGFGFRNKRRLGQTTGNDLGITELKTTSVPQMMAKKNILGHIERDMQENFPKRLSHLLGRASRFGKVGGT